MERSRAFEELLLRIENKDTIRHSLAVEAIMKRLAKLFHEEVRLWGITGLVHDIDVERILNDNRSHGMMGGDILECLDFDPTIVYAVRAHNPENNYERRRKMDKALFCASPMAELIEACYQFNGDQSLNKVSEEFVLNKYKDLDFAPHISRERIALCSELGFSVEEFIKTSLEAMREISSLN
ncbi:MAG: HDIG domain-containing protein [Clostridiaceae bacterium]|nr:HDIG domain-containing protein [Clostridiaceae bacterium]